MRHISAGHAAAGADAPDPADLDARPRGIEAALHAYLRWERNLPHPAPGDAAFIERSAPAGERRLSDAGFRLARHRFLGVLDRSVAACAAGFNEVDA
ncbi:hypothetical protein [Aliidongia dinghuensis]|uniref:hypothetical protein n=1 Tax=Aliidongia dinghuensis TaxID=1867774 RepID=UPI00166AE717|nr:hypothetical protein [Aliidongia dinghuensis]